MWLATFYEDDEERWRYSQRIRLVNWTSADAPAISGMNDMVQHIRAPKTKGAKRREPVGEWGTASRRKINRALMDVSFEGDPVGCEEPVCEIMENELAFGPRVSEGKGGAADYKYLLDVDGNGWSSKVLHSSSNGAAWAFSQSMTPMKLYSLSKIMFP